MTETGMKDSALQGVKGCWAGWVIDGCTKNGFLSRMNWEVIGSIMWTWWCFGEEEKLFPKISLFTEVLIGCTVGFLPVIPSAVIVQWVQSGYSTKNPLSANELCVWNSSLISPPVFLIPCCIYYFVIVDFEFLSVSLWGRICSFQLLRSTAATKSFGRTFPGGKNMFIFSV